MAIYGAIILFARHFSTLGFKEAIIQNFDNDEDTLSTVFYVVVALSSLSFAILSLGADLFIKMYDAPNYWLVFTALSSALILDNLTLIHSAKCTIDLDLRFLNFVRVTKVLVGAITGITLAVLDFELVAVFGQIWSQALVGLLFFGIGRPWYPRLVMELPKIKKLFQFGSFIYLSTLLNNAFSGLRSSVLGLNYSPGILAQMNKSGSFNLIYSQSISGYFGRIIFPVLSGLKNNKAVFATHYLKGLKITSIPTFFLCGLLFFVGPFLIITIYGDQWIQSSQWIQIICFQIYFVPLSMVLGSALKAMGKSKELFYLNLIFKLITVGLIVSSFYIEPAQFLMLTVVLGVVRILLYFLYSSFLGLSTFKDHLIAIRSGFLAFGGSFIAAWIFGGILGFSAVLSGVIYALIFGFVLTLLEKPLLLEMWAMLRSKLS